MNSSPSEQPKRVLIVSQHYWPETFRISDIAEGLVERGYVVDVLCGMPNYPSGKFFPGYGWFKRVKEVHNGVNIYRSAEIPRGNNTNLRIFINFISFPFFAVWLIPKFMGQKYDRILAYQLSPVFMTLPAILLAKVRKIPLYFYICDFWPHSLFSMLSIKNSVLRKTLTKISYWHYRQADGAIGAFKGMAARLVSEVGLAEERVLYIPQAPEKIYESRQTSSALNKRFRNTFNVVFAGNINPAQCFDVITQAAKIVKDAGISDIRYVILGEGMSKKWLIDEVENLGMAPDFVFEGLRPVEEVPMYQSIADALIVALSKSPLFEYGIPAKVYSYMPSGKPILGSMDGAGKELINQSGSGICVDSGDIEGLAKAILQLYNSSPEKRKAMGQKGFSYYQKHFERENNLDRLIQFVFHNNKIADTE